MVLFWTLFITLKALDKDLLLQVGYHKVRVEGDNPLPQLAVHSSFDAAQDVDEELFLPLQKATLLQTMILLGDLSHPEKVAEKTSNSPENYGRALSIISVYKW